MTDAPRVTMADGKPVTPGYDRIEPETGMQRGYVVLAEEERAKGFVRPVRRSYQHVGIPPPGPMRDLTPDEQDRYASYGYVKFEPYPEGGAILGVYWTQERLGRLSRGCGQITTMAPSIAETYARTPSFYGSTFCRHCGMHYPVGEKGEFVWADTTERVGT